MLEKIGKIANSKLLSGDDQKKVLGGVRPRLSCDEDERCNLPGWCCSHQVCVDARPRPPYGTVPACE